MKQLNFRCLIICSLLQLLLFTNSVYSQSQNALQKLEQAIKTVLNTRVCKESEVAVLIQELDTGRVLFQQNADLPLQPASNLKLLTTIGALELLTPEYKFKTSIHYCGDFVNGVITGNLYLVGGGDPLLVKEELWKIADSIYALGVRRVTGNLVIDSAFFDDVGYPDDDWKRIEMPLWYNAPTGGAASNFNAITVFATPGKKQGDPIKITIDPPVSFFNIQSTAVTAAPRSRASLVLSVKENQHSCDIITKGTLPAGMKTQTYYRHLVSSDELTGHTFRHFLNDKGIIIEGKVVKEAKPEKSTRLHVHESRTLSELLILVNKFSNNFMTEQILKTIAAEIGKCPGTTQDGTRILKEFFDKELHIDTRGMVLSDGSGLSRRNKVTARQFCELLRYGINDSFFGPELLVNQPVAGVDGTLKRRLNDHSNKRLVRAKTGSINNVICLTGLIDGRRGKGLVFSILINKNRGRNGESRQAQDRMLEAMLDYWASI
ncbi:MAG: D-alanyl-D-alanine carboxypeptidase/D-alanyl-D-alanine-endopeptidase [bacterium]